MAAVKDAVQWSTQLALSSSHRGARLPGDKIILPPSALEQLLSASASAASSSAEPAPTYDPWNPRVHASYWQNLEERQQQLPQPLTFRLLNPENGRVVYAGIQEFSADEEEVIISPFLQEALGLEHNADAQTTIEGTNGTGKGQKGRVTVHFKQLQKGTFVKLRPLEAGYDVEDWKSLLEQHMRANFTTLTKGEVLKVPGEVVLGQKPTDFRFLVDEFKPDEEAICVVDTDLEVDIEALNEEQARETVKRIAEKFQNTNGNAAGTSKGGDIDIFKEISGQILPGEYADYQLLSWPRNQAIEIEVNPATDSDDVDLLMSPFSSRQRARPRVDNYVFANWEDRPSKRIKLQPTNIELEDAEALYVSVYAFEPPKSQEDAVNATKEPRHYAIRARVSPDDPLASKTSSDSKVDEVPPNPGDVRCKNCGQWVPERTLMLHENFCLRNNILCPHGCGQVFQKRSATFSAHWHCPHDTFYGDTPLSHSKHDALYHPPSPLPCTRCSTTQTFASIPLLAQHHVTTCPAKLILCKFCHLSVPQEGDPDTPDPTALLSGLTPHELADGSRTTECHLCGRITRMRDMDTHLKHHDLERLSRPRPRVCRNVNCGNTLDGAGRSGATRTAGKDNGNDIGLCGACFAPLYVTLFDPEGKALKRRIERRYLQQLMTGCGKGWCLNEFCRTGRKNKGRPEEGTAAKTALVLAKPFVDGAIGDMQSPLQFCVDEGCQRRRERAGMLEVESQQRLGTKGYSFPWCVAAIEAEEGDLERARQWMENYAPKKDEERL